MNGNISHSARLVHRCRVLKSFHSGRSESGMKRKTNEQHRLWMDSMFLSVLWDHR